MQINLRQTVEHYDDGYAFIAVHKFTDENLERINGFSNSYVIEFLTESKLRLYFTLFGGYNITLIYDFNLDVFTCDLCTKKGEQLCAIVHIDQIEEIINVVEEHYMKLFKTTDNN